MKSSTAVTILFGNGGLLVYDGGALPRKVALNRKLCLPKLPKERKESEKNEKIETFTPK